MTEGQLNQALVAALRQRLTHAVVFKLADRWTTGIPDISVDWHHRHIWIEVKFADPDFTSTGAQELTMTRLARHGEAWYIIYENVPRGVYLVAPEHFAHWKTHATWHGTEFDHDGVIHAMIERP